MKNRFCISLLLAIAALCAMLLPVQAAPAPAASAEEVLSIVRTGFWDTVSAAGKTYWTAHYGRNGTSGTLQQHAINRDYLYGMTNKPCPHTGSHLEQNGCTSNYIGAKGNIATDGDSQCSGFAAYMAYVVFGRGAESNYRKIGASSIRNYLSNTGLKTGDIIRYQRGNGPGHSVFVYQVIDTSSFKVIECNADGVDGVRIWARTLDFTKGKTTTEKVNDPIYVDSILYIYSSPLPSQLSYVDKCTAYHSSASLIVRAETPLMSCPCSSDVSAEAHTLTLIPDSTVLAETGLYKNTVGEFWYKVSYNGTVGYIYAGDAEAELTWGEVTYTNTSGPSGTRNCGAKLSLKGSFKSTVLPMTRVGIYVFYGSAVEKNPETGSGINISSKSYTIDGTSLDDNCKMGNLYAGPHSYVAKAQLVNNYSADGKTLTSSSQWFFPYTKAFTVAHSWSGSTCSRCGVSKSCSHSWTSLGQTKPAACEAEGETTKTCAKCKTIQIAKLEALGHDLIDEITKEPTATQSGIHTKGCSRCSQAETFRIPSLAHTLLLPEQLQEIEEEALFGIAAQMVVIPQGVLTIEANAFACCPNLKALSFLGDPASVMAEGIPADIAIFCSKGSSIEQWAAAQGYRVMHR